jgi:hypothetical protein
LNRAQHGLRGSLASLISSPFPAHWPVPVKTHQRASLARSWGPRGGLLNSDTRDPTVSHSDQCCPAYCHRRIARRAAGVSAAGRRCSCAVTFDWTAKRCPNPRRGDNPKNDPPFLVPLCTPTRESCEAAREFCLRDVPPSPTELSPTALAADGRHRAWMRAIDL